MVSTCREFWFICRNRQRKRNFPNGTVSDKKGESMGWRDPSPFRFGKAGKTSGARDDPTIPVI